MRSGYGRNTPPRLTLSLVLVFTLFISTHAVDVAAPDTLVVSKKFPFNRIYLFIKQQSNQNQNLQESARYMAKRRFLPTRRELYQYINDEAVHDDEEDLIHLNSKRYFLKSKRYFLNSKRDNERREEEVKKIIFQSENV